MGRAERNGLPRYHHEIWGTAARAEPALFEALMLGVFESGLSWRVVFAERDASRRAIRGFDVAKVHGGFRAADYTARG